MLGSRLAVAAACRLQLAPAAAAAWLHTSAAAAAASGSSSASGTAVAAGDAASKNNNDQIRQAFAYCVSQVQTHDYENYLWVAQLPKVRCVGGGAYVPMRMAPAWHCRMQPAGNVDWMAGQCHANSCLGWR